MIGRKLYGLDELTTEGLESAQSKNAEVCGSGQRLRILRDEANLDHVQTDGIFHEVES